MSRSKKAFAFVGVAAGLVLAALPLASYAAETTTDVSVTVDSSIAINVDESTVSGNVTSGGNSEIGDVELTVTTNNASGYTISIRGSGDGADVTRLYSGSNYIPAGTPAAGTSAWGYKGGNKAAASTFQGVTASDVVVYEKTGATPIEGETDTFTFGSSTSTSQVAGTYTGQVTWTVTAAN